MASMFQLARQRLLQVEWLLQLEWLL